MARPETLEALNAAIGGAIVRERKAAGKSQEDVAYEAGMSVRHLRELEKGAANPTVGTLHRLGSALGVNVRVFLGVDTLKRVGSTGRKQ